MALPNRIKLEDIKIVCEYFATKPTGATIQDSKSIIDRKYLTKTKIHAYIYLGLIEKSDKNRYKLTESGRELSRGEKNRERILLDVIRKIPAYTSIVERAAHNHLDSISSTETAAHWHEYFKEEAGESDTILKDRAVCFFHIIEAAGLGKLIPGRKGHSTRISFSATALDKYISMDSGLHPKSKVEENLEDAQTLSTGDDENKEQGQTGSIKVGHENFELGQNIFIAHGKNKEPLEQLKKILDQFKIPYKVAVDEPNLGRPISGKVRDTMHACNCAILIFTADEEFQDKNGNTIWRPSENVIYELGATGYLYDNRLVILKEEKVTFPSNFNDLGYISFVHNQLEAKAIDVLKELIGFDIVKFST